MDGWMCSIKSAILTVLEQTGQGNLNERNEMQLTWAMPYICYENAHIKSTKCYSCYALVMSNTELTMNLDEDCYKATCQDNYQDVQ